MLNRIIELENHYASLNPAITRETVPSDDKEITSLYNKIVDSKIESVSAAIKEIRSVSETVAAASKEIQLLAKQSADGANDTSAATEEQLAANQEISSNAQSLAHLSEVLQREVSHFKFN